MRKSVSRPRRSGNTRRAGPTAAFPWGNTAPTSCKEAVITGLPGCSEQRGASEVGTTHEGKSPFGVLDMAGNVWEWVSDGWGAYPSGEVKDPRVSFPAGSRGILRGGSWDYAVTSSKTTYRLPYHATAGNQSTGFRCARDAHD
jgi:formylglycine-generating enzyme required for sulfatase activity